MIRRFDLWLLRCSGLSLLNLNTNIILRIAMRTLIIILLFFSFVYAAYLSTFALLKVEMSTDINSEIQIYWANEKADFSEQQSLKQPVFIKRKSYWFLINHFNQSTRFRIDPVTAPAHLQIKAIELYSLQHYPVNFNLLFDTVKVHDIDFNSDEVSEDNAIKIHSLSNDPQFELRPVHTKNRLAFIIFIVLLVLFLFKYSYLKRVFIFILAFLALYISLYINETTLTFKTDNQVSGQVKVFWRNANQGNSYTRARTINIEPNQSEYIAKIDNVSNIEVLYLQANNEQLLSHIQEKKIIEPGFKAETLEQEETIIAKLANSSSLIMPLICFFIAYAILAIAIKFTLTKRTFSYSSYTVFYFSFFMVAFLIINLSWQADYNIHPDENAHIESVHYYSHYWDPPVVGDARALHSYQMPWAISRLDDLGISYFFAGKFENLVQLFFTDTTFTARAFNALLFILLFSYSRQKRLVLFMAPLLCTPQAWYLYSYANRDAFALFISLLLAWQLVNVKSALNNFLQSPRVFDHWRYVLIPGALLGLLSIEQTNYYLFILFFLAFLLWRVLFFVQAKRVFIYKCLMLIAIAVLVFLTRFGLDAAINGADKYSQRVAYAEQHAGADFKPSIASTPESYSGLRLKDKGVSLLELFKPPWDWHKMTFKSFSGFYGYYAQYSPHWYYMYVLLVYSLLLLITLRHAVFIAQWRYQLFSVLTGVALFGGLLMGMLFSWLYDFQPQGRYIFPIIPIILVYFWVMAPFWLPLERAAIMASALMLMVLSFYSFNEVALNYLFA
ncbi:MAG: hypothetical protein P1P78_14890 [Methyloprofundus sp.]|nr:hypothetical protein [Methyloprofundus sp.]